MVFLRVLLYNILFIPAFILLMPFYIVKQLRRKGLNRAYTERFGWFGGEQKARLKALDRPVWIHAVSVGEVVAAVTLINEWRAKMPERSFVLSTTTTTGHALARKKLPDEVPLIYCPIDCFFFVLRTVRLVRPSLLLLLEVEIWPNLIWLASWHGVPLVLANGRLSERSAARYVRHRWFFRDIFQRFSLLCVQSDTDAARVRSAHGGAGAPVRVSGTMKFDQVPEPDQAGRQNVLERVFGQGEARVFTGGSTHPGEEELVLDAFLGARKRVSDLKLILAPRHHERTAEVEELLQRRGMSYRLLSACLDAPSTSRDPADVLLVDTTGELMNLYAVSDVVFVGKSLAGNAGGHNIIEPAIFGKPILHGPAMDNFRTVAHLFQRANASVLIQSGRELQKSLTELLEDREKSARLGERARQVVDNGRGATTLTVNDCENALKTMRKSQ